MRCSMTTKAKCSTLPILPPEIWDDIFDRATYVPGTLVPEIYDQYGLIGPLYNPTQGYYPALRAALVTGRYLVRVCKQWWHLASPYLYRSIYIEGSPCVSSLCSTLTRSAAGKGTITSRQPLGLWTQRLDVVIYDHTIDVRTELARLADVISCLPNLVIVSFPFYARFFKSTVSATVLNALHGSAASLRVLEFSCSVEPVCEFVKLLRACSQLRILNCHAMVWSPMLDLGTTVPNVTTLELRGLQPLSALEIAPQDARIALKELVLLANHPAHYWHDFMHHYGSCLTAVHLYFPIFSESALPIEYVQLLEETCPNIRRMTLSLSTFTALRNIIRLPPVDYLGLSLHKLVETSSLDFPRVFSFLARVGTSTPSIRVVQLTSGDNVDDLLRNYSQVAVDALTGVLAGCKFRLEDEDGNLLKDRLWALGHLS